MNFSEEKLKRMLKAESPKMYAPDMLLKNLENKTNAFCSPKAYSARKLAEQI